MPDEKPQLDPSDRMLLSLAATRRVGADLLVNVGGATAPVQRLDGAGPGLWAAFAAGRTIAEAAADLAEQTGAAPGEVEQVVLEFAAQLIQADLAEPAS